MLEISYQLPSTRFQVCSCNIAGYRGISFLQDRGLTLIGIWSKWNRKWKFEYSITCCWTWTSKGLFKYINTVNIIEHDIFKQSLQPGPLLLDSQLEFQLLGLMLSDRMKSWAVIPKILKTFSNPPYFSYMFEIVCQAVWRASMAYTKFETCSWNITGFRAIFNSNKLLCFSLPIKCADVWI